MATCLRQISKRGAGSKQVHILVVCLGICRVVKKKTAALLLKCSNPTFQAQGFISGPN